MVAGHAWEPCRAGKVDPTRFGIFEMRGLWFAIRFTPGATTTIPGNQLPPPAPKFGGVIKDDALQSKAWWAPRVVPPKGAPNILLIMTDDAGFGVPSTFGGVIPTPTMDRIAQNGLRYNRIFSTSLCSPTRAALITGRNHHSVGFGVIAEQATGFPGYDSVIGVDNATVGRILRDNGYATSWFGKDHNTPIYQASQVGPFTQWPTGMGFDYFYGFVGGDANQWGPNLFRSTTQIYPWIGHEGTLKMDRSDLRAEIWPVTGKEPSWNLITAMADDAIDWMYRIRQTDPNQPIFLYYVPGSSHAPHHPMKEWVDKIHEMHLFDGVKMELVSAITAGLTAGVTPWRPRPSQAVKDADQALKAPLIGGYKIVSTTTIRRPRVERIAT
jgi:Sulfatase